MSETNTTQETIQLILNSREELSMKHENFELEHENTRSFETSVYEILIHISDLIPSFNLDEMKIKINIINDTKSEDLDYTDKALNDMFSKSGSSHNIRSYRDVYKIEGNDGVWIGVNILSKVLSISLKAGSETDIHKAIIYAGELKALVSRSYPLNSVYISSLFDSIIEVAALNEKEFSKITLEFNDKTGDVRGEVFFDRIEVNDLIAKITEEMDETEKEKYMKSHTILTEDHPNSTIAFGFYISTNLFGDGSLKFGVMSEQLKCVNKWRVTAFLNVVNSSPENIARKLYKFFSEALLDSVVVLDEKLKLPSREVLATLRGDKIPTGALAKPFYDLFARVIFELARSQKIDQEKLFQKAATTPIQNLEKELKKISKNHPKIVTSTDIELIMDLYPRDNSINFNHGDMSQYDMLSGINAIANNESVGIRKRENLQNLVTELIQYEPLTNKGRTKANRLS